MIIQKNSFLLPLRNADSAGDKTGAQRIAGLIQQRRSTQTKIVILLLSRKRTFANRC